jgi:hypothetical protein
MANTPPSGTQFAIPNFTNTSNTYPPVSPTEPGTATCVATGQLRSEMDGTYTTTGSHFYTGGTTVYSSVHCFEQNGKPPIDINGYFYGPCWMSRSGSNNYNGDGSYAGSTSTTVSGSAVNGEYVSITAPYSFILRAYSIISANYNGPTNPAQAWTIAGSNDGTTWTTVHTVTNSGLSLDGTVNAPILGIYTTTSTTAYSSYIIIITNSQNGGAANIGTWNLYSPTPALPCFVAGTRILTQSGCKAIEDLQSTDNVMTADNRTVSFRLKKFDVPITDITTAPYCIEAGAFGPNKPAAPLCLSPTHKIQLRKGIWISPERAAQTNPSIQQYDVGKPVTYYHIACDNYLRDNIIAEGMVVETLATSKNYNGPPKVYTWSDKLGGFTRISANKNIVKSIAL